MLAKKTGRLLTNLCRSKKVFFLLSAFSTAMWTQNVMSSAAAQKRFDATSSALKALKNNQDPSDSALFDKLTQDILNFLTEKTTITIAVVGPGGKTTTETKYSSQVEKREFQTWFENTRKAARITYNELHPQTPDMDTKFAQFWKRVMNNAEIQKIPGATDASTGSSVQGDEAVAANTMKSNTTFLNLMLRSSKQKYLASKIQVMIEFGADKNLHPVFANVTQDFYGQDEYPLKIAITQVLGDVKRQDILSKLLDDSIQYNYNKYLTSKSTKVATKNADGTINQPDDTLAGQNTEASSIENYFLEPNKSIAVTLNDNNIQQVLNMLLPKTPRANLLSKFTDDESQEKFISFFGDEEEPVWRTPDYASFDKIVEYIETKGNWLVIDDSDAVLKIKHQIKCPLLENMLKQMAKYRELGTTHYIDNIDQFYKMDSNKYLQYHIKQNNVDAQFDEGFQHFLASNSAVFEAIGEAIDAKRVTNDRIAGSHFKEVLLGWTVWAQYRNRMARHLNRFAMNASLAEDPNTPGIVRLARYANTFATRTADKNNPANNREREFRELSELEVKSGNYFMFRGKDSHGWTPLMYAMIKKRTEGLEIFLNQAFNDIKDTDGMYNNVLHLAFPLPEEYFNREMQASKGSDDAKMDTELLDLVSPGPTDDVDFEGKTLEIVKYVLHSDDSSTIDADDKVYALKQMSNLGYTPISFAASLGFFKVANYMIEVLKGVHGAWDESNHSFIDTPIYEKLLEGMIRRRAKLAAREDAANEEGNDDSSSKSKNPLATLISDIDAEILKVQTEINESKSGRITTYYDPKDSKKCLYDLKDTTKWTCGAVEYYNAITSKMNEYFDRFKKPTGPQDPTKQKKFTNEEIARENKLSTGLNLVIQELVDPTKGSKDVKIHTDDYNKYVESEKVRTGMQKFKDFFNGGPSPFNGKEWTTVKQSIPGIHDGIKKATTAVKLTYLLAAVETLMDEYFASNSVTNKVAMSEVYFNLTQNKSMDFFERRFNRRVELTIQDFIKKKISKTKGFTLNPEPKEQEPESEWDSIDSSIIGLWGNEAPTKLSKTIQPQSAAAQKSSETAKAQPVKKN